MDGHAIRGDARLPQVRRQVRVGGLGPLRAANLLIVPKHHGKRASGGERALLKQRLDGLADAHHALLVVNGTAPHDVAVHDGAGEGGRHPRVRVGHGHHIQVRVQRCGLQGGVTARPHVHQGQAVHHRV